MKNTHSRLAVTEPYKHYSGKTADSRSEKKLIHRHERHRVKQTLHKGIWDIEE